MEETARPGRVVTSSVGLDAPYPTEVEAAQACASDIARILGTAFRSRGRCVFATCGGRSAALVLRLLEVEHPVIVVPSDERWLPLDSPERNDLQLIGRFDDRSVIRPPFSGDVVDDANDFARSIWSIGTPDVVLLSMADDGHVASLFPNSDNQRSSCDVIIETRSPKPPSTRLSLSYASLRKVPHRLMMAIGADKTQMIDHVRQGFTTPATRTRPTRWYLDSAASSANGGGR